MSRYIDADEFVKRVIQYPRQSTKTIGLALADTPTADVVQRKSGEWISHILSKGGKSIDKDVCSLCGKQYADAWSYNFCPNCGAKMDGKETANEKD